MTPEEADRFLSNHDSVTVVERDLAPEEREMGQAQFLITIDSIDNEPSVQEDIESRGLDFFKESSPSQFRHVAMPPADE